MTGLDLTVRLANLDDPRDADAVLEMTRAYARDPMGGGKDLDEDVKSRLIGEMRSHPALFCVVAWEGETPVGIATCLVSFSTFRAKRLVNIHDLSVVPGMRGRGVSRRLLQAVEEHARAEGCAKVTLEVLGRNQLARDVYAKMGFDGSRCGEEDAKLFCAKDIE